MPPPTRAMPATASIAIPAMAPPDMPLSLSLTASALAVGVLVGIVLLVAGGEVVTADLIVKRVLSPVSAQPLSGSSFVALPFGLKALSVYRFRLSHDSKLTRRQSLWPHHQEHRTRGLPQRKGSPIR